MSEKLGSDRERVAAMRGTHRTLARAQYAEVEVLTGWFRRGAAADHARAGGVLHGPDEGASAVAEAATLLRMSESAVNRSIDIGLALDELPCARAAFAAGDLDLDQVRVIVDVTAGVSEAARAELDRRMAERALSCGPAALRGAGRRWAHRLDPVGESERRKRAVEDRDVRVRARASGMAYLDGWLPIEGAQTVAARLAEMAQEVCADDARTFPQRRADALVALADGSGRLVCQCGRGAECPKATEAGAARAPLIQVGVSLETLLGLRDWPGYLAGPGAVDADTVRMLARDGRWEWLIAAIDAAIEHADAGCSPDEVGDIAGDADPSGADRAGADPASPAGSEAAAEPHLAPASDTAPPDEADPRNARPRSNGPMPPAMARAVAAACAAAASWDDPDTAAALRYQWPEKLAKWLRARDGSCRFPNCQVPASRCDIDHTLRFDHADPRNGGRTIRSNGACLCRRHHAIKTAGENGLNGWRVRQLEHGRLEWTTPTGEVIITDPEGAAMLWPDADPESVPVPDVFEPVSFERPTAIAGLSIADESVFAEIEANTPQHSIVEEWLEFVLDSYPSRGWARFEITCYDDDPDPPPF